MKDTGIGFQLINGIWHQVIEKKTFDPITYNWVVSEDRLPEPEVTLSTAGNLMKHLQVFQYMRYW